MSVSAIWTLADSRLEGDEPGVRDERATSGPARTSALWIPVGEDERRRLHIGQESADIESAPNRADVRLSRRSVRHRLSHRRGDTSLALHGPAMSLRDRPSRAPSPFQQRRPSLHSYAAAPKFSAPWQKASQTRCATSLWVPGSDSDAAQAAMNPHRANFSNCEPVDHSREIGDLWLPRDVFNSRSDSSRHGVENHQRCSLASPSRCVAQDSQSRS